jgi:curved DNA-binding protein CbpA
VLVAVVLWAFSPGLAITVGVILGGLTWALISYTLPRSQVFYFDQHRRDADRREIDDRYDHIKREQREARNIESSAAILEFLRPYIKAVVDFEEQMAKSSGIQAEALERKRKSHQDVIDHWLSVAKTRPGFPYDHFTQKVKEFAQDYREKITARTKSHHSNSEERRSNQDRGNNSGREGEVPTAIDMDCFSVLGLRSDCSREEARNRFRSLAKSYHPDVVHHLAPEFQQLAEQKMKELNGAFKELHKIKGWSD